MVVAVVLVVLVLGLRVIVRFRMVLVRLVIALISIVHRVLGCVLLVHVITIVSSVRARSVLFLVFLLVFLWLSAPFVFVLWFVFLLLLFMLLFFLSV